MKGHTSGFDAVRLSALLLMPSHVRMKDGENAILPWHEHPALLNATRCI